MRFIVFFIAVFAISADLRHAVAEECPGNPDALGTSRVLYVDPAEYKRVGIMQYDQGLPLADHEVVLTFDDGPLPPFTTRILDALKAECVKATFFVVGMMAKAAPQLVKRAFDEGHSIGTHTQHHPFDLPFRPEASSHAEINNGIASAAAALGDRARVAPFFRFPAINRSPALERYLESQGLMVWSSDISANDWVPSTPERMMAGVLSRLEARPSGIITFHDIQERTATALPVILRELKRRGFQVVHVKPAEFRKTAAVTE